jgi:hypothetical protein
MMWFPTPQSHACVAVCIRLSLSPSHHQYARKMEKKV